MVFTQVAVENGSGGNADLQVIATNWMGNSPQYGNLTLPEPAKMAIVQDVPRYHTYDIQPGYGSVFVDLSSDGRTLLPASGQGYYYIALKQNN